MGRARTAILTWNDGYYQEKTADTFAGGLVQSPPQSNDLLFPIPLFRALVDNH